MALTDSGKQRMWRARRRGGAGRDGTQPCSACRQHYMPDHSADGRPEPAVHIRTSLQIRREGDTGVLLIMRRYVVHQPRRKADQVARLGEEVLAVVEGRDWLEVPLLEVLLVVVDRG